MGDLIREHLVAKQISHRTLDGSVPLPQRGALVEEFQKPEGPRVTAYILETRDSIEERLSQMLSAKRGLAELERRRAQLA